MSNKDPTSSPSLPAAALIFIAGILALSACARDPAPRVVPTPAGEGAALPRLTSDGTSGLLLSWVEPRPEGHALLYSTFQTDSWSEARTAAEGSGWFLNWADFPSVLRLSDERMAAHWLRKLEGGPYAYEVMLSVSNNDGRNWSKPVPPHGDGTPTEHGFVSLFPLPGGVGAVWLDGRHTAAHGDAAGHQHGAGAMTLRAGGLDWSGAPLPESELDDRVCDCCGTAVATGDRGTTVLYRDRSENEIRDIRATTLDAEGWSVPVPLADDGWEMPGCPVNGPAIAGRGEHLAAAWFTAAQGRPRVLAAFSADAGRSWTAPTEVAAGQVLGRVAVVMPDQASAVVSWLEQQGASAAIRYRQVHLDGRTDSTRTLATSSPARSSGFPQLALAGDQLVFAWTRSGDAAGIVTATVPLP